jgi:hypothetical protein
MKIICADGLERDFISLFDLYVLKGFDPALLLKDGGLLSLNNPPGLSFSKLINLAKLGIISDGHFMHYSWKHKKINPISISEEKVLDGYKWLALSPAFKWQNQDQLLGMNLSLFTFFTRLTSKVIDFFLLNHNKKKTYESLVYAPENSDFKWATGYEYLEFVHEAYFFKQKMIILSSNEASQDEFIYLHPTVLGWSMHVFVAK